MDGETLIVCPFDPNHKIRSSRFEFHLLKCQKNNTNSNIEICPFNAKHTVHRTQIRDHIAKCPDRVRLAYEHSINRAFDTAELSENTFVANPAPSQSNSVFGPFEENWDNEIGSAFKNQPKRIPNQNIVESYQTLKRHERKQLKENMIEDFKKNSAERANQKVC